MLSNLAANGLVERIARGQYALPGAASDELFVWQQRAPRVIYSHETALYLHDMAERAPLRHAITLPGDCKLSATFPADLKVYYVKPALHELGVVLLPSKMGHRVRAYDIERTVCDILRNKRRIDAQTVVTALKNYAAASHKNLNRLRRYAEAFRLTKTLQQYLEILL
jgi:predicted transcriptional regulator of viral defense system